MLTRVKGTFAVLLSVLLILCFSSCGDSGYVMKVGDTKITADEYYYYWNNHRKANPDATQEEIKKLCEDSIRSDCALWALADDVEFSLSDSDNEEIENNMEEAVKMYGDENGLEEALKQANMTKDVYKNVLTLQTVEISLRNYMREEAANIIKSDDETVEKDIPENFCRIRQILICNDDGDDTEANKALADSIYTELVGGTDFDALVEQYSEDINQKEDGYAFTYGQMVEPIEENAFALAEGEISNVFEYSDSFAIIKRLPITEEYINENFETLRYYYQCRIFNEMREEAAQKLEVKYTDSYKNLELK